ncbi:MAG: 3-hydroxyacyl-CoA dehydrogenase NAD-binding domain-containing protein [Rhizobiaceae bacterium]
MSQVAFPPVVILGAGIIGVSFAAAFLDAGAAVTLVEPDQERRNRVRAAIAEQQKAIETAGLKMGLEGRLEIDDGTSQSVPAANLVLECGPEDLEFKQRIFAELIGKTPEGTILATASSAIPMSRIVADREQQARCLVAHPVNPPSVLRLVEIAPAPGTDPGNLKRASDLFTSLGFWPVTLAREIEGFILNRLQGAVLREAYRLVDDGVAGANDIDKVMRLGLGPRWALSGPFETAELNTAGGIEAHVRRMGPAYRRMGEERGETTDWRAELVDMVVAERRQILALEDIPARVEWRADAVAQLVAARDRIASDGKNHRDD